MSQEQVQKQTSKTEQAETEQVEAKDVQNEKLAESTENTLASIDDVLGDQDDMDLLADLDDLMGTEEEAQALVAGFVQQGGE